ncbi:NUDIX hydrolase [Deinococcus sp. Marseille-Q6407]|uniref:NUDIX hydrolase n=1 Tax=Deinococcus sp. Marseille-Q6407 TaxID=2969223 RepID=UPI0021C1D759|nr:NUDIX domain-containing protein [Deinococcus sp. Marseille-Q6407]
MATPGSIYLITWTVVQDPQGRVLLARRSGAHFADGLWNLPGGGIEPGEDLRAAAAREVREEVGLELSPERLESLGVSSFDQTDGQGLPVRGVSFFFRAHFWSGEPRPLDKTGALLWADPAALPPGCLPWLPRALQLHLLQGARLTQQLGGVDQPEWTRLD